MTENIKSERIILGIDPGTNIMGYGLIQQQHSAVRLVYMDVLRLSAFDNQPIKLKKIFETAIDIINTYKPDELAIEAPFYGKNVQSMLKLGRAQGVAIAAALTREIPVFEYSPKKIKQSITGKGNASKEQVSAMLQRMLGFSDNSLPLDATDAVAVAVCHYFQGRVPVSEKKYSGWASFLKENPERIKGL